MVDPARLAEADHTVFVGGGDPEAKAAVTDLLRRFGRTDIVDLGDITTARGTEMLPVWLRLFGALQSPSSISRSSADAFLVEGSP
jgi:predicted dinucleotide-binding enzyme